MRTDRFLNMLGLAMKAGKVVSGEFAVDAAGKSGDAKLIILAEDASERTKKSVTDMCRFYEVPYLFYSTKEGLGRAIGKENRAQIAITDSNFAIAMKELSDAASEQNTRDDV